MKKIVRIDRQLIKCRHPAVFNRYDGGRQVYAIRFNQDLPLQNRIEHPYFQAVFPIGNRRFIFQAVANENNAFGPRLLVKDFPLPKGPHIAV